MTHPQDPEQQAIEAYMRGMGYERQRYSRADIKGWRKPSADARMYFFVEYEQALDFYRTHQAQVAEARQDENANWVRVYETVLQGLQGLARNSHTQAILKQVIKEHKERIAQLNPQKPKEKETS